MRLAAAFRAASDFPLEHTATFRWIPGVAWSDHRSFWHAGYPALMITDMAFYRYPYYHTPADTPDKLGATFIVERTGRAGKMALLNDLTYHVAHNNSRMIGIELQLDRIVHRRSGPVILDDGDLFLTPRLEHVTEPEHPGREHAADRRPAELVDRPAPRIAHPGSLRDRGRGPRPDLHSRVSVDRDAIAGVEKGAVHVDAESDGERGQESWQVIIRGIDDRLPISRRQWSVVKSLVR